MVCLAKNRLDYSGYNKSGPTIWNETAGPSFRYLGDLYHKESYIDQIPTWPIIFTDLTHEDKCLSNNQRS